MLRLVGLCGFPWGRILLPLVGKALWGIIDISTFEFDPDSTYSDPNARRYSVQPRRFRFVGTGQETITDGQPGSLGDSEWANLSLDAKLQRTGEGTFLFQTTVLPVLLPKQPWVRVPTIRGKSMKLLCSEARLAQITGSSIEWQIGVSWLSVFVCTMDIKQQRLVRCLLCQGEFTFFKLFRSYREELLGCLEIAFKGDPGPALLCVDCEVLERLKEIERWTRKGRSEKAFPEKYADKATVLYEIKQTSKGDQWYKQAKLISQATQDTRDLKKTGQVRINQLIVGAPLEGVTEEEKAEFIAKGAACVNVNIKNNIESALIKRARTELEAGSVRQWMKDASMSRKLFMQLSVSSRMKNIIINILNRMFKGRPRRTSSTPCTCSRTPAMT